MKIPSILKHTAHRPWAKPSGPWKFYQEWNRAVFLHWPVEVEELKPLVPDGIQIDTYAGQAWVSVVAFTMKKVRPRLLPPVSFISDFHEINIRTYVKSNQKTGVYFLSIEGGKWLSCSLAKQISKLPYRTSQMKRIEHQYQSANNQTGDRLTFSYQPGQSVVTKTKLDLWLTERYALFQDTKSAILEYEIHHLEWPIQEVELADFTLDYPAFNHLLKGDPELTHYSSGVQVVAWGKQLLR